MKTSFYILLTILVSSLAFSCSKKDQEKPSFKKPVYTAKAISEDVPVYIESFGYLVSNKSVDIQSQITGQILSTHFKEGDFVKKGDLLFTIDPRIYKSQLDEAKADYQENMVQLKYDQYVVSRDQGLQNHGAISDQDYYQLLVNLKKTMAAIDKSKAQIENTNIQLEYCDIKSPIDGVTGVVKVDPGNIVQANAGPTLVNIKTIDPLFLDFSIPEKNFSRLQNAMSTSTLKVLVFVLEFGIKKTISNNVYIGNLEFFSNSIDHETGTIFLRASVPNKKHKLWPGQFVSLYLVLDELKNATMVPFSAVSMGLKGNYLFIVDKDNKAKLEYVKVGQQQGDYIVITSDNIKPGDRVVTLGQMGLAPGVEVEIIKNQTFKRPDFINKLSKIKSSKTLNLKNKIDKNKSINSDVLKNKNIPKNSNSNPKEQAK